MENEGISRFFGLRMPSFSIRKMYFLSVFYTAFSLFAFSTERRTNTAAITTMPIQTFFMASISIMASMQSWPVPSAPTAAKRSKMR